MKLKSHIKRLKNDIKLKPNSYYATYLTKLHHSHSNKDKIQDLLLNKIMKNYEGGNTFMTLNI